MKEMKSVFCLRVSPVLIPLLFLPQPALNAEFNNAGVSRTNTILVIISTLSVLRAQHEQSINTKVWSGLQIQYGSKVTGSDTWFVQKVSNLQQCLRTCWLYRACASVTFVFKKQKCLLYKVDDGFGNYRTVSDPGSVAIDMRSATMVPSKVFFFLFSHYPRLFILVRLIDKSNANSCVVIKSLTVSEFQFSSSRYENEALFRKEKVRRQTRYENHSSIRS